MERGKPPAGATNVLVSMAWALPAEPSRGGGAAGSRVALCRPGVEGSTSTPESGGAHEHRSRCVAEPLEARRPAPAARVLLRARLPVLPAGARRGGSRRRAGATPGAAGRRAALPDRDDLDRG